MSSFDGNVLPKIATLGKLIGSGRQMREVFELIERSAASKASVLISGESGTGKELVATSIHELGLRAQKPLIALNCGAFPSSMIEALLFGHERGAFTGALESRAGFFEQAHGGTLFLDEIGELPLELQTRLLRTLETGKIRRIGGQHEITIDIRLLSATHRDLFQMIDEGTFRADLFYRIFVVPIYLPPLRNRKEDIEVLSKILLLELTKHTIRTPTLLPCALEKLEAYEWPGNVRELKNTLERSVLLHPRNELRAEHIKIISAPRPKKYKSLLLQLERATLAASVQKHEGNRSQMAKELGIPRSTLATKMKKHALFK
ncbi:MAG: hypothetical protein A3I05_03590 [Deltaproteobacteria bacterium RIFCSPLOWO2_02_FULL_44_10]|nr:MAG: hypothetical protein A3C46_03160 [Deltaproteobacteria bacterium RIFCSPHIGHO2_02_FULL_44_16]OGQ46251.1 MAG: hypothetical protein A3I05_03590 [Deltaproteobacteria bacterium RIFCSPLOWO2_02_FULL_44_10]